MKIAKVEALHCDGGWRPWTFVRIETDGGLVGWGECSDNRSPWGIAGCVRDMADLLIGQDPRPVERIYWDMLRRARLRAVRRSAPRSHAALLVALRHHAGAHGHHARHAAAEDV